MGVKVLNSYGNSGLANEAHSSERFYLDKKEIENEPFPKIIDMATA